MALEDYLDGVYYDRNAGEYCRIIETGDTIGLVQPNQSPTADPYFTFEEEGKTREEALAELEAEFTEVPENAVKNPSNYINGVLDVVESGTTDQLIDEELLGLEFARQQVTITETT